MKWFFDLIASLFGAGGKKRKLASLDSLLAIGGLDYFWSKQNPKKLCDIAVDCNLAGIGAELGEKMNTGPQGVIRGAQFVAYYTDQIKKLKKLAVECRRAGLWLKVCWWNSNAICGKDVALADMNMMFDYFVKEIGTENILLVPYSENDDNSKRIRDGFMKHVLASSWPSSQMVKMDDVSNRAFFTETHISRLETRLHDRPKFFITTDHGVTISNHLSHEDAVKCAKAARKGNLSFHFYGFDEQPVVEDWKAIGEIYA